MEQYVGPIPESVRGRFSNEFESLGSDGLRQNLKRKNLKHVFRERRNFGFFSPFWVLTPRFFFALSQRKANNHLK